MNTNILIGIQYWKPCRKSSYSHKFIISSPSMENWTKRSRL